MNSEKLRYRIPIEDGCSGIYKGQRYPYINADLDIILETKINSKFDFIRHTK